MRYQQRNNSVIRGAFSKLAKRENTIVLEGMMRLARAGLAYLVEAHNNLVPGLNHTQETDTLAYAISYNGEIKASGMWDNNESDQMPGEAREEAKRLLSGTKGWVCIIISDMEYDWYRVDWEIDFLHYSAMTIKMNFNKFFKKIK